MEMTDITKTYFCTKAYSPECINSSPSREQFRGSLCFPCYEEKMRQYHRNYYATKRKNVVKCITTVLDDIDVEDEAPPDRGIVGECNCKGTVMFTGFDGEDILYTKNHPITISEGFVYLLFNSITGSYYVGKTKQNLAIRKGAHLKCSGTAFVYDVMRQEGSHNFKMIQLQRYKNCCNHYLNDEEKRFIKMLKPPLNSIHKISDHDWKIEDEEKIINDFNHMIDSIS